MNLIAILLSVPSFAAELIVDPAGSTDFTTIEQALNVAQDGDTISLYPGDHGNAFVDGPRQLTINGVGRGEAKINSLNVSNGANVSVENVHFIESVRAIDVANAVLEMDRVNITGGGDGSGFAIRIREGGSVQASNVVVDHIESTDGAIQIEDGTMNLEDSSIFACTAAEGAALRMLAGQATLSNVVMTGNHAIDRGGATMVEGGQITMNRVWMQNNEAREGGAAFFSENADAFIEDIIFTDNQASSGGHVYFDGNVTMVRSVMSGGQAQLGAAAFVNGGTINIQNALWWDQEPSDQGGALFQANGHTQISYATISQNRAEIGAAVAIADGSFGMNMSIVAGNDGAEGIANASATPMEIMDVLFWDNGSSAWIGAISDRQSIAIQMPGFVDGSDADFALRWTSPALDYGHDSDTDTDFTPADLGAYGGPNGWTLSDSDGDGFVYGRDCDDSDADINENAIDFYYDGIDSNCDESDDFDQDGDGYAAVSFGGQDCDDTNPFVNPGAIELVDKEDQDCDGHALPDNDGDGWPSDVDCDDSDNNTFPGAEDAWYDGHDSDCAGNSDFDADGDGYDVDEDDCDDADPFINPDTIEIADDGIDQNCDGQDLSVDMGSTTDQEEITGEDQSEPAPPAEAEPTRMMTQTGCSSVSTFPTWTIAGMAMLGLIARRREE